MSRKDLFFCWTCRQWLSVTPGPTAGYGSDAKGRKHCFACCGKLDAESMRETGRGILYSGEGKLTNWPGTLEIDLPIGSTRVSRHNIAGKRVDYWFTYQGRNWHGVRYGDMTSIVRCRRLQS